jgi:hypothetical protein
MITITLEGESWRDILREMSIIEASVRGSKTDDLPERASIAKDCRKCHSESLAELASILKGGYGLGLDEVYDILERAR